MKKTKYIMSEGLAFAEEKDMEKLRKYSLKGWHVKSLKLMGYMLEKGESQDFIYSIDYRHLDVEEGDEYFDYFASAGWTHIASEGYIHLFRALPGTKPIYSDQDTSLEKYHYLYSSSNRFALPLLFVTCLSWAGAWWSEGVLQMILFIAALLLTMFAVPAVWTAIAAYSNEWKVKGNRNMARLIKVGPAVLVISAVVAFMLIYIPNAIRILIVMAIAGMITPVVISSVLSLYYKISGRS